MPQVDYTQVIADYEAAIAQTPDDRQLYWHYGLALLLDQQAEAAQTTWWMVLADAGEDEVAWCAELGAVLQQAAITQTQTGNLPAAALIRQSYQAIVPDDCENLLHLLWLAMQLHTLDLEALEAIGIIPTLNDRASTAPALEADLLLAVVDAYLADPVLHPITIELVEAIAHHLKDPTNLVEILLHHSHQIAHVKGYPQLSADLIEVNRRLQPQHFESLLAQADFATQNQQFAIAIQAAEQAYQVANHPIEQIAASRARLQAALSSGRQDPQLLELVQTHGDILSKLLDRPSILTKPEIYRLINSTIHLPYIADQPAIQRLLQNQVMQHCEQQLQNLQPEIVDRHQLAHGIKRQAVGPNDRRKIGYLCRCFHRHSVGWLARWLLKHHDHTAVELYIYLLNPQSTPDSVQQAYLAMTPNIRGCDFDAIAVATQIHQDQIEILVELDSLTCQVTCEVMALKPAPIQVSWLGWDAPGMSAIDYFIADPYVLPEAAQAYYPEKIVRLPHSYLAVDGFEVGEPSIDRQQLGISATAVVFMSAQRGYKRHPVMMQLQLQILQQVPNSYLLIKGLADQAAIQTAFFALATAMEVAHDRLIFLPIVKAEEIHRANLAIADVILDTFPYNGATTTMEALWMERPIVTLVGQQFSARNSYTMMINAGITEGISWTPEEYVAWGIRLGTEPELRQQVAGKLRQGKQTAPLWNGKAFAQQMEAAYTQMYQTYVEQQRQ
jgi:predicted O-linked N-acetylglucosamine transferase (SPINDLY family)